MKLRTLALILILTILLSFKPSLENNENKVGSKIDLENLILPIKNGLNQNLTLNKGSESIKLVFELNDEDDLAKLLESNVVLEACYKNLIQGRIPINLLPKILNSSFIRFVKLPSKAIPFAIQSEGVNSIQASLLHSQGVLGENVKVAIIDLGFDVLNPEIQSNIVEYKSFRADKDITGGSSENLHHGTACAEILIDVAPKAKLYLFNFETDIEFLAALEYAVNIGVKVISCSIGFVNVGPYDGTSYIDEAVDEARDKGVLFVTAAGNEALEHWSGSFKDEDKDGFHEFYLKDETNEFLAYKGSAIRVFLSWNDWPYSSIDYDLYLLDEFSNLVAYSNNPQTGFQPPIEEIFFISPKTSVYRIVIEKAGGERDVKLHLFNFDFELEHYVESESLTCPAEAKGSLTVGAVFFATKDIESFSSRGPTDDGRIKPDLTGPDGVSTSSYGSSNFFGTSASAPHVAGVAALLLSINPNLTPDQIQLILEESAIDKGASGKDNIYGAGVIDAFKAYNLIKEKKTLEVHAHSIEFQYPNEPSEELNIEIMITYMSGGLTRSEIVKPISKIFIDYGTEVSLKITSELTNYSLVEWDDYGIGRVKTQELTLFMNGDKIVIAYFKLLEAFNIGRKAFLTIHAHLNDYQYPKEPSSEVKAKILINYFEDGLEKSVEKEPIFQVSADYNSTAKLTVTSIPPDVSWLEWDNYGFGRINSINLTVFVDGSKTLIAYFKPEINIEKDFSLSISPQAQYFFPGQTINYTIFVSSINGFNSEVTFNAFDLPPNSTAQFNPQSIKPNASTLLMIRTSPATPPSSYKIRVVASSSNIVKSIEARLNSAAIPGFKLESFIISFIAILIIHLTSIRRRINS
ncbi:S8 family serine peptidase [Candidatus Bathyarchaeota archaeon]|nr:S8 family serine peptidase [Candidatus Bathyarchaeota archaeon]